MKKVLLVTFSDNADHQDTLFGMYEELRKRSDWDAYLLCIKTPKVELQQSDHTWLVDCPERPGVTKKTFNLPLLLSIIHRIRREHFDTIYFESLHTWNLYRHNKRCYGIFSPDGTITRYGSSRL